MYLNNIRAVDSKVVDVFQNNWNNPSTGKPFQRSLINKHINTLINERLLNRYGPNFEIFPICNSIESLKLLIKYFEINHKLKDLMKCQLFINILNSLLPTIITEVNETIYSDDSCEALFYTEGIIELISNFPSALKNLILFPKKLNLKLLPIFFTSSTKEEMERLSTSLTERAIETIRNEPPDEEFWDEYTIDEYGKYFKKAQIEIEKIKIALINFAYYDIFKSLDEANVKYIEGIKNTNIPRLPHIYEVYSTELSKIMNKIGYRIEFNFLPAQTTPPV